MVVVGFCCGGCWLQLVALVPFFDAVRADFDSHVFLYPCAGSLFCHGLDAFHLFGKVFGGDGGFWFAVEDGSSTLASLFDLLVLGDCCGVLMKGWEHLRPGGGDLLPECPGGDVECVLPEGSACGCGDSVAGGWPCLVFGDGE